MKVWSWLKMISKKRINSHIKNGLLLISTILFLSFAAPWITHPQDLKQNLSDRLEAPSFKHFLGTDEKGCDVLAKILYGGQLSLLVSVSVVGISAIVGLLLGSLAGYVGGATELMTMSVVDLLQAFPGFLLALTLIAFMGSSLTNVILALSITGWAPYCRLVRAEIKSIQEREFVAAAKSLGAGHLQIILKHLWPNVLGILAVQMTFGLSGAIISESGLSFLGLGVPPQTPSWGALLNSGRRYLVRAPTLSIFPGFAIVILVLGFNLFGEGLRRYFNPKIQPSS